MNRCSAKQSVGVALLACVAWITIPAFGQTSAKVEPNPNARAIQLNRGAAALWRARCANCIRGPASSCLPRTRTMKTAACWLWKAGDGGARGRSLLTLNRGEGGQNVMGPDLYDALGLVRTQELLAADRYMGVDQYFTRAIDFGFSKTREEALKEWDHDRVLSDVVRVIRMTRPLIVASVFAGAATDGHGHHQVAGQMAQEVYNAAADPKMFPDQIRAGLRPWAPLKMYVRTPFATISSQGVFDYATGHWAPARFHDYINNTWIEGKPSPTLSIPDWPV